MKSIRDSGGVRLTRGGLRARRVARVAAATAAGAVLLAAFAGAALAAVPTVVTGAASAITYQSATLAGSVDPRGTSTVVYFQYGTTSKYGAQSAPDELPAGTATVPVSIGISGLAAGVTYHYRIVATNASGTSLGADHALITARIPLSLAITAAPNPVPFGGSYTVEGTLSGTGSANAPVQLQSQGFPYAAGFANVGNPELTLANGSFAFNLLGASGNTEFRVVSGNAASADVIVSVSVGVTMNAQIKGTRQHPEIRFSGTITPAEPSARIAFERLIGAGWKVVGGTVAKANAVNGVVGFAATVHVRSGGFFRALVLPVEGSHTSGYSPVALVRLR